MYVLNPNLIFLSIYHLSPINLHASKMINSRVFCQQKLKDAVKIISSGSLLFASYLTVVGDERFYSNQLMPLLQRIVGAETAHILAVKMIGLGVVPLNRYQDPASLVIVPFTTVFILNGLMCPYSWATMTVSLTHHRLEATSFPDVC